MIREPADGFLSMWALALVAAVAMVFLVRWKRSGKPLFDFTGLMLARLYTAMWHRRRGNGPAPFPAVGPGIVVSNHTCSADPTFIHAGGNRVIGYLTAREHYQGSRAAKWFLDSMRCVPVSRNCIDVGAIRSALRLLDEGHMIGIFPEGNLSGVARNRIRPGKAGVALLALRSRAPVFPVYIAGGPRTEKLLKGWLRPSKVPVHVYYGKPIDLSAYYGRPINRQLLEEVTEFIMQHVVALRPKTKYQHLIKLRGSHEHNHDERAKKQALCSL
jgi:1-acyl-sn-glycerol-3-phosphate acyltransferase